MAQTKLQIRRLLERYGPLLALLVLVLVSAVFSAPFRKPENLFNILNQNSGVGIIAIGMTFVIIVGGIDLSVGALLGLAGGVGVWVMNTVLSAASILSETQKYADAKMSPLPYSAFRVWLSQLFSSLQVAGSEPVGVGVGITIILLVAMIAGLLNGVLIAKGKLAPFIVTIGTLAGFRACILWLADGGQIASASEHLFPALGSGVPIPGTNVAPNAPIPVPLRFPYGVIVFGLVAFGAYVLLNKTRFGRHVYAVGANERAAVYSAINVDRVKLMAYSLIGATVGIAAVLHASRFNSVSSAQAGQLLELDAIAAVVIGGASMRGGVGTIGGTVIGVLLIGVIGNMMSMFGVPPYPQGLVKGLIIIAAVLIQGQRR